MKMLLLASTLLTPFLGSTLNTKNNNQVVETPVNNFNIQDRPIPEVVNYIQYKKYDESNTSVFLELRYSTYYVLEFNILLDTTVGEGYNAYYDYNEYFYFDNPYWNLIDTREGTEGLNEINISFKDSSLYNISTYSYLYNRALLVENKAIPFNLDQSPPVGTEAIELQVNIPVVNSPSWGAFLSEVSFNERLYFGDSTLPMYLNFGTYIDELVQETYLEAYSEGYDYAFPLGYDEGYQDRFASGLQSWIVPAIILVLFVGGGLAMWNKRRQAGE